MKTASRVFLAIIIAALITGDAQPSFAGPKEDRAWIDTCVAERVAEKRNAAMRRYCTCMRGIADKNETLSVTELERSFPPAHAMCHRKAGLR